MVSQLQKKCQSVQKSRVYLERTFRSDDVGHEAHRQRHGYGVFAEGHVVPVYMPSEGGCRRSVLEPAHVNAVLQTPAFPNVIIGDK